jgi:rubrerythrin
MSLVQRAIELEKRAEDTYRNAQLETSDPGAKRILGLLADEEAKHAKVLREMGEAKDVSGPNLVEEAKKWVTSNVEGGSMGISPDASLVELLRRGMDVERTTEEFYRSHVDEAEDERQAALFDRLADIEREHFQFVSSLVEYYNRPKEWVEDAEFGLRPEY